MHSRRLDRPERLRRRNIKQEERNRMICAVCGDMARGYNFNAITCDSCKVFFRRICLKENAEENLASWMNECKLGVGNCTVTTSTRKMCSACRMKMCFAVGMKREWITPINQLARRTKFRGHLERKSDNMPHSKNTTFPWNRTKREGSECCDLEADPDRSMPVKKKVKINSTEIKEQTIHKAMVTMNQSPIRSTNQNSPSSSSQPLLLSTTSRAACLTKNVSTSYLFDSYKEILKTIYIIVLEPLTDDEVHGYALHQKRPNLEQFFNGHEFIVRRLIRAFKQIPQFILLTKDAQMMLVQNSVWGLINLFLALHVNVQRATAIFKYGNDTGSSTRIEFPFDDLRYAFREGFYCIPTEQYSALLSLLDPNQIDINCTFNLLANENNICEFMNHQPISPGFMSIYDDYVSYSNVENKSEASSRYSVPITISGEENGKGSVCNSSARSTTIPITEDIIEKQINRMINNFRDLHHKIIDLVSHDKRLLIITCLLRLFSVEEDKMRLHLCTSDEYLINFTQNELQWFLVEFASCIWRNDSQTLHKQEGIQFDTWTTDLFQCGTLHWQAERVKTELMTPLSYRSHPVHLTVSERLLGLKQILGYISKTECFLMHMLYYTKMDKMNPLIQELLTNDCETS